MRNRTLIQVSAVVLLTTAVGLLSGCGKKAGSQLGVDIPAGAPVVKLADVMSSPADYNGKQVVIKGRISGQCPSLCEFFMKEGPHQATIFPKGYKFPKFETGSPVTVYAAVTAGAQNVVLNALGVRLEKE